MIAITGANGQLGRLVIDELRKTTSADRIIAVVRNPDGAADLTAMGVQVRHGDYDEPSTLDDSFVGADRILLVSSNDVVRSVAQHAAVIAAAKNAGVGLLAYTSILHADTSSLLVAQYGRDTEPLIRDSGLPYSILRNSLYQEVFAPSIAQAAATGELIGSAGSGRVATATRADYAAAAAAVLTGTGHENTTYELTGDVAWSFADLVAEVSEQSGKDVVYRDIGSDDHLRLLVDSGVPRNRALALVNTFAGIASGELSETTDTLRGLIGRASTPLGVTIAGAITR